MAPRMQPLDVLHAVDLYRSGEPLEKIARRAGVSSATVRRNLKARGVKLRSKAEALRLSGAARAWTPSDPASLLSRYADGDSVERIAGDEGVTGKVIATFLRRQGVNVRGRGEALKARLARMTPAERRALTAAGRAVADLKPMTSEQRAKSARTKQRTGSVIGTAEAEIEAALRTLGLIPTPQLAVGQYNVDLALPPVAVEVHVSAGNPTTDPRRRERARKLLDSGWHVVYIWLTRQHFAFGPAVEKVAAFTKLAQSDPSLRRECRVIRGSGERAPVYGLDAD